MDELAVYRGEELTDPLMRLPGYDCPGTLPDIIQPHSDWISALSLSVFRRHPDDPGIIQTLTGIRRASTHEGVVSTLTGAFPPGLQRALVEERAHRLRGAYPTVSIGRRGPDAREVGVVATYKPNTTLVPGNQDILPYLCHDMFARKLGLASLISMRYGQRHLGTVSLSRVAIGVSYVDDEGPDDAPLWEPLVMYGAAFMLDDMYRDAIPEHTERYSYLGWTDDVTSFNEDVSQRNVEGLAPYVPPLKSVEFCARGMCLSMTAMLTAGNDLRGHLGLPSAHADAGTGQADLVH